MRVVERWVWTVSGNKKRRKKLKYVLSYKPEGRGFDSRWCHWNFSLTQSFRPHYGPGVDSASNRNEYQEYFLVCKCGRCLWLTILSLYCADCFWNLGASSSWNPQGLSRPVMRLLYLYIYRWLISCDTGLCMTAWHLYWIHQHTTITITEPQHQILYNSNPKRVRAFL